MNEFQQILSPNPDDDGVWIHQDAWFNLGKFDQITAKKYEFHKKGNGVYIFILKGSAKVGDQVLEPRDGFGIWETENFTIEAGENSEILMMEVPMN